MTNEQFYEQYGEFAKRFEEERLEIYDDGTGVPTTGVGFALIIQNW